VAPAFERCKHHEDWRCRCARTRNRSGPGVPASSGSAGASRQGTAWRSRPGTPAGNRDRVAACRLPAHLPWRLRTRHWLSAG
jgi:hypothetical protein